jgi:hypothetical protein
MRILVSLILLFFAAMVLVRRSSLAGPIVPMQLRHRKTSFIPQMGDAGADGFGIGRGGSFATADSKNRKAEAGRMRRYREREWK